MGLDPNDDDYEAGVRCNDCEDSLFGGVTPLYVWAHVKLLESCPLFPHVAFNGSLRLGQTGDPCVWNGTDGIGNLITWTISPGSIFTIKPPAIPFNDFWDWSFTTCLDKFENMYVVCGGANAGKNGSAVITWGPDDPCSNL